MPPAMRIRGFLSVAAPLVLAAVSAPAPASPGAAPGHVAAVPVAGRLQAGPAAGRSGPAATGKWYLEPRFEVRVTRNVVFDRVRTASGRTVVLRLDLYRPRRDPARDRPAMVFVHGGGFATGDKSLGPAPKLAHFFASLGYVAASIDYRLLSPRICTLQHGFSRSCFRAAMAAIHDSQAAVRWLRRHHSTYRVDTGRIGIEGESAGGIAATGVGMLATAPRGAGAHASPYSDAVGWFGSISGGMPHGRFVRRGGAPGILFSGTKDPVVPFAWSLATTVAMRDDGVPARLVALRGAGHVPWTAFGTLMTRDSVTFAYRHLHLAGADE